MISTRPGRPCVNSSAPDAVSYLLRLTPSADLTAEDLAMLARLDDADQEDELDDAGFGPDTCPVEGWELMSWAGRQELLGDPEQPSGPEVFDAGFTHRDGGDGRGFAAGGALNQMDASVTLAVFADRAWQDGLGGLSDYELVGVMAAQRRLASRAAAGELAAIAELAARRAGPDGRPGEHVQEEVAAALTLTSRAAAGRVGLAGELARLPAVARALAAGRIDVDKAEVFTGQLMLLEVLAANAIAALVLPEAPEMTTGKLRTALVREIMNYDPEALIRRRKEAEKDARVEVWAEAAGTGAVAGRDLPPADVLAADKTLDADARWLKNHGAEGSMDQLRAKAFTARLTGQSLYSLLPPAPDAGGFGTAGTGAAGTGMATDGASGVGMASDGASPAGTGTGTSTPGAAALGGGAASGGWPAGPGSSVNLTMSAAAWLGRSDTPGQISGLGAADAWTCRDVANALAASPATRWCVTLIGENGQPVAHGCARAGPGPPGAERAAWLATVKITPIETGACEHSRESAGYQPSDSLRHIIKIRSPRCGAPGCRRPAVRCDDDHTIPYDQGGRTCECNLYPLCRRHHRTKQARGWHLRQPQPGVLIWTAPSGRQYTTRPERYPV
jgi:hypothetical protein